MKALHLASVWNDCARQIGKTQNDSVQRFRFQGVLPGKKQFSQFENVFHWLQQSSLIIKTYLVEKPEIPLSAYIKNSLFKAFIFDVGILNALLQISAETILTQDPNTTKGFIAENFLAQELLAQGFDTLFSWEGKASQIEFLLEHKGKILPVEVKSGTRTSAKSLMAYCAQFDPHCKFIFSLQPYSKNGNLIKIPLYAPDRLGSVLQEAFASPKA